jgi:hypothetical protein
MSMCEKKKYLQIWQEHFKAWNTWGAWMGEQTSKEAANQLHRAESFL